VYWLRLMKQMLCVTEWMSLSQANGVVTLENF